MDINKILDEFERRLRTVEQKVDVLLEDKEIYLPLDLAANELGKSVVYQTFKIVDDPEREGIENSVGLNSSIGKARRGGIMNQKIVIQGYDSAVIVNIVWVGKIN